MIWYFVDFTHHENNFSKCEYNNAIIFDTNIKFNKNGM